MSALREPEHLDSVVIDAWETLSFQTNEDQAVLDDLRLVADSLLVPARHDGLSPWQSQRLTRASERLDGLADWFAEQRTLDLAPTERTARPGVLDSLGFLTSQAGKTASGLFPGCAGRSHTTMIRRHSRLRLRRSDRMRQ